jgi:Zn ribbon nucleic-acid-binding protein
MSVIAPSLPATCANCQAIQIMPEWSESAGGNETVYFWRCVSCGHEFETRDRHVDRRPSRDELLEEFLPSLVIE